MHALKELFAFIEPGDLQSMLRSKGFSLVEERNEVLVAGKAFWLGIFQRS